jgi:hypothetical protein
VGLDEGTGGRVRVEEVTGVRVVVGAAAIFLEPTGLLAVGLGAVVEGWMLVRLAGVAATGFVAEARSDEVAGANDILLGFADMPSFVFSSPEGFSSTVLSESLFLRVTVAGLRSEDEVVLGLAGGLLRELPTVGLLAVEAMGGREDVGSLGEAVLVNGLVAGCAVFGLRVVVSSFLSMAVC